MFSLAIYVIIFQTLFAGVEMFRFIQKYGMSYAKEKPGVFVLTILLNLLMSPIPTIYLAIYVLQQV